MAQRSVRGALAGRGFMLFPASAFAVHQLRYELGYGSQAGSALASQGHGYLDSLAPWVALMVALGFGRFLSSLAQQLRGRELEMRRRSFAALWSVASVTLLATYALQELLEGLFAAGHPGGINGVFGHGGLWAVPLSVLAGLLVAALLRLACTLAGAVSRFSLRRVRRGVRTVQLPRRSSLALRRTPLADHAAGRAPPGPRFPALV